MKGEGEVGGAHGRRGPGQSGPAQAGWALLVIAMALIGGLAAATLVDASLLIAVVVSVVIGAVGVVVVLRSPAREPELTAPRTATMPRAHPRPVPSSRAAPPPAAILLGWELVAVDPEAGTIEVAFTASEQFLNPAGVIQGGFLAAMLDDTLGPALVATLVAGRLLHLHPDYSRLTDHSARSSAR